MGNRLSKIYTRTGDDGTTGMADGSRLTKSDLRFDVIGKFDTLNAQIGLLRCYTNADINKSLHRIQHQLFNIGGELAMPEFESIRPEDIQQLENEIDAWNMTLQPLKDFILPAGSVAICQAHIARCQCREAERLLIALAQRDNNISLYTRQFINRLSDWLFVLARIIAKNENTFEVLWQKNYK